jgi:hypothetical protein
MKAQWDEGDGRILLGDNTSRGAVMLLTIRFRCVEFGYQLYYLECTYIVDRVCTYFRLAKNSRCCRSSGK